MVHWLVTFSFIVVAYGFIVLIIGGVGVSSSN